MEPEQFVRLDSDNPVRGAMEIYSTKDDDAYISPGQIRGQRIAIRPLRYSDAMNTIFVTPPEGSTSSIEIIVH